MQACNPYKQFNRAFKGFVLDLIQAYPGVPELKLVLAGYKLVKRINEKLVVSLFATTMGPYEQFILKKDASVFLAPSFQMPDDFSPVYKLMLPTFVSLWQNSPQSNQDAVWRHLHYLIALQKMCGPP